MSSLTFDVPPDTEGILSAKSELKGKGCKDSVLLHNLDLAESIFRNSPLSRTMRLVVGGEWQSVRIGEADGIIYTVTSQNGQAYVDGCIYCRNEVSQWDVMNIHFSMHSCQNEIESCFLQARVAAQAKNIGALKITCNRFSITYTTKSKPESLVSIKTKCQLSLPLVTVAGLLEKKCWVQKEKAGCRTLIAGLDHLINMYLTVPEAPKQNCKFLIQGDGDMAEIISSASSDDTQEQYTLLSNEFSKISMYPPSWQKN